MTASILESRVPILLEHLNPESKPKWGKMSPQHMVEHLQQALLLSIGKFEVQVFSQEEKLPALKQFLMSPQPLPRNFQAPVHQEGELPALQYTSLQEAKSALLQTLEAFEQYARQHPDVKHNHPVFGPLNAEEWRQFHQKHFTHHFTQFALIEDKL